MPWEHGSSDQQCTSGCQCLGRVHACWAGCVCASPALTTNATRATPTSPEQNGAALSCLPARAGGSPAGQWTWPLAGREEHQAALGVPGCVCLIRTPSKTMHPEPSPTRHSSHYAPGCDRVILLNGREQNIPTYYLDVIAEGDYTRCKLKHGQEKE